jgi:hypothetical protein
MNYVICKILTPDFYAKFLAAVEENVEAKIKERIEKEFPDGVPDTEEAKEKIKRLRMARSFHAIMSRDSYYFMWGHKDEISKENTEILKNDPLWEPEFFEEIFKIETSGWQSKERIMWKGKIEKIDSIDEIIASREPKDHAEREWFLAKKHETESIHRSETVTPA